MDEGAYREASEVVHALAVQARREARELDEHRAALARNALVWWQGGAAERYQQLVRDRVSAVTLLSARLDALGQRADRLVEALDCEADLAAAIAAAQAAHPLVRR